MLRNRTINNIVKQCKFNTDTIELPKYINTWTIMPTFTYNKNKKCRQLEEKSLTFHPKTRSSRRDNIFNYKNNKPLHHSRSLALQRFSLVEPFASKGIENYIVYLLVIVSIIIILTL
jgi:hypothetical protein